MILIEREDLKHTIIWQVELYINTSEYYKLSSTFIDYCQDNKFEWWAFHDAMSIPPDHRITRIQWWFSNQAEAAQFQLTWG